MNNSLMSALMKNTKKKSVNNNISAKKKVVKKEFDYKILVNGGEGVLSFKDSKGVSRVINISVHTNATTYISKYKYHFKNALGWTVYIKTAKSSIAQDVCDFLTGEKGKYKVSGSVL